MWYHGVQSFYLIPILNDAIPACREQFARFVRVPERCDADTVMRLPFLVQFRGLPVPNVTFSVGVTGHEVTVTNKTVISNSGYIGLVFSLYNR